MICTEERGNIYFLMDNLNDDIYLPTEVKIRKLEIDVIAKTFHYFQIALQTSFLLTLNPILNMNLNLKK